MEGLEYFSLHNHTDASNARLIDSINKTEDLIQRAFDLGLSGVAITDHETIKAHAKASSFIKKKKENDEKWKDFKLIYGNEIYLCRNNLNAENYDSKTDKFFHFILLAIDERGHEQIRQLSTRAYGHSFMKNRMRRVPTYYKDIEEIVKNDKGHLIASTGCLGGFAASKLLEGRTDPSILEAKIEELKSWISYIQSIFGKENFFFELQPSFDKEQVFVNKWLVKLSEKLNIPAIITTDSHYGSKEDRPIHKAYLNSKEGEREVDAFYATAYMMGEEEIHSYLDENLGYDKVQELLDNTKIIGNRINQFYLERPFKLPYLPSEEDKELANNTNFKRCSNEKRPEVWDNFINSNEPADRVFIHRILNKCNSNPDWFFREESMNQIEVELDTVWQATKKQNIIWSKYFLQVADYIGIAWNEGDTICGIGRGCFTPEMKVSMKDGRTKKIADVEIGDEVFTHTGEIHKVKDKFIYDIKEKLYHLKIEGTEDIICTNNHKIFGIHNILCKYKDNCVLSCRRGCETKKELKPEWIEAQKLSPNDMVAIPRYKYSPKSIKEIDLADYTDKINYCSWDENYIYTYHGNNTVRIAKKYKRFIPVDKNFLYFLGVFIGDGWVKKEENNRELGLCFNSCTEKDKKSQERIIQYLEDLEMSYQLIEGQNGKQVNQIRMINPFLGFFLNELCGHGAENKHIPQIFLYDNYEEMQELLWGLMNSDGCVDEKGKRISYDTINFDLANQVRNLLSYLGIYSSIKSRIPKDNRKDFKNSKISYKVRASGKQLSVLPFVKFSVSKNIVQRDDNYFYPRVKEIITESYEGKVYDLSVEKDTSYIINNIAVHNSGGGFYLNYLLDITQADPLREPVKTYYWRYLNPERVSILDCDTDIQSNRRNKVIKALQKRYGEQRVVRVMTEKTEASKSSILTAARGLGIDNDIAQYIASLIESDRGKQRSLHDTYYGNEEDGFLPNKTFVKEMEKHPELWKVAQKIEGLANGVS